MTKNVTQAITVHLLPVRLLATKYQTLLFAQLVITVLKDQLNQKFVKTATTNQEKALMLVKNVQPATTVPLPLM